MQAWCTLLMSFIYLDGVLGHSFLRTRNWMLSIMFDPHWCETGMLSIFVQQTKLLLIEANILTYRSNTEFEYFFVKILLWIRWIGPHHIETTNPPQVLQFTIAMWQWSFLASSYLLSAHLIGWPNLACSLLDNTFWADARLCLVKTQHQYRQFT